jgi:aryl-alcohol dehydrogenase-like predicted oxidoreductase
VIPGASSIEQLERNVAAADLVLAPDQVAALTTAAQAYRPVSGPAAVRAMLAARVRR